jgi:hypothetical protein
MSKQPLPRGVPEAQTPIPGGTEEQSPPPKFGTARPADPAGDLPRLTDALDRVKRDGPVARYKIRCNNYHPQETRYILSQRSEAGEKAARELYLKVNGLDLHLARLRKNGVTVEEPDLVVRCLED